MAIIKQIASLITLLRFGFLGRSFLLRLTQWRVYEQQLLSGETPPALPEHYGRRDDFSFAAE